MNPSVLLDLFEAFIKQRLKKTTIMNVPFNWTGDSTWSCAQLLPKLPISVVTSDWHGVARLFHHRFVVTVRYTLGSVIHPDDDSIEWY